MKPDSQMTLDLSPKARRRDAETSQRAAASMREGAAAHRAKILLALQELGGVGGTYTEIAQQAHLDPTAVDRRLIELRKSGQVIRRAEQRPTPSGRDAFVHCLVAFS